MKKVIILVAAILFLAPATFAKGPDEDTLTNEQLLKKIQYLESRMGKVEKKLTGKISAVEVNLEKYEAGNNTAVSNLVSNLATAKKEWGDKLKATNDSIAAMSDSTGVLTKLKNGNTTNKGKISMLSKITWSAVVTFLILLIIFMVFRRNAKRTMQSMAKEINDIKNPHEPDMN